MVKVDVVS